MKTLNTIDFQYTGNLKWLKSRTLYLVRHGSMCYGTNQEGSDVDLKGFCCPPLEYYFGVRQNFDQAEWKDPDAVVYNMKKFLALALDGNPTLLECLFVDEEDQLIVTPYARKILDNKDKFISKAVRYRFGGFAYQQLHRIKTHREFLLNPPKGKPNRSDFGLHEKPEIKKDQLLAVQSLLDKTINNWVLDFRDLDKAQQIAIKEKITEVMAELKIGMDPAWASAARTLGCTENFVVMIQKEKEYNAAVTRYHQYLNWLETRNPERAKMEAKFLFDGKFGLHAVRLLKMAVEILETGKVIVRRPDREELLSIRNGGWTYEQLIEWADKQFLKLDEAYEKSTLPYSADNPFIENLCAEITAEIFDL